MGFFFRKSVGYGPLRINFSKSGVGASLGVKGIRVTAPARGSTYITVGSHGFYYRQPLPHNFRSQEGSSAPNRPQPAAPGGNPILTADVSELAERSHAEIVNQLNERSRASNPAVWIYVLAGFSLLAVAGNAAWGAATVALLVSGGILHRWSNEKRWTRLFYELNEIEDAKFNLVKQGLCQLQASERLWRVEAETLTHDRKRNAGAAKLTNRSSVSAGTVAISRVETNVGATGVDLGGIKLLFLPDVILYWQSGTFAAISYSDLIIACGQTQFVEGQTVPRDAVTVGSTWQYVNKNGGPDRRFSNNRQLPVVQYGTLELTTTGGLNLQLQTSSVAAAVQFVSYLQQRTGRSRAQNRPTHAPPPAPDARWGALKVLGLDVSATPEQISQAYRKLAQMYHPDKVAGLAPEFQELADQRMKEINAAYASLARQR